MMPRLAMWDTGTDLDFATQPDIAVDEGDTLMFVNSARVIV